MKRVRIMGLCVVAVLVISAMAAATASALSVPGVLSWGQNTSLQLGSGTVNSNVPLEVTGIAPNAIAVAGGANHSVALLEGGEVEAWGENLQGELGNGAFGSPTSVPVKVCAVAGCGSGPLTNVKAVAAGDGESLAVLNTGEVVTWGLGQSGALGNGGTANSNLPVYVCALAGCSSHLTGVVAVAAGETNDMALLSTGEVVTWGANNFGQLGDGTFVGSSNVPVKVCAGVGAGCTPKLSGVKAISAGGSVDLALLNTHEVVTWGRDNAGQLGDGKIGDPNDTHEPVGVCEASCSNRLTKVTAVSGGGFYALALLENSKVVAWGADPEGQLGDNNTANEKEPVKVCAPAPTGCSGQLGETAEVSAGYQFSEARLQNGEVRAWGENQYGQLGDGTGVANRKLPVTVCSTTVVASTGPCPPEPAQYQVGAISAGFYHGLALVEPPHYFSDGLTPANTFRIPPATTIYAFAFGSLTLTNLTTHNSMTCNFMDQGTVENPLPGGVAGPPGQGETLGFTAWGCQSAACTAEATKGGPGTFVSYKAENLPWKSHLVTDGSLIRSESIGVKDNIICHIETGPGAFFLVEDKFAGSLKPSWINQCVPASGCPFLPFPLSEVAFDPGSGNLTDGSGQLGKTAGNLELFGYTVVPPSAKHINTQSG